MSTMDTTALARIMLGGFNQGAGLVSNAAQINDSRARAAQQQAQYEQEVAYRLEQQRQQESRQLAQMSALANFAESRGLLQPSGPSGYGPFQPPLASPSPTGPFQPGMEPAMPQQAAPSMGLDRATLMGMDPRFAGGVVEDMLGQQQRMETAQFEQELKAQAERRSIAEREARRTYIRGELEKAGFTPEQIARSLAAQGLADIGTPAGVITSMFNQGGPAADWQMGQGLGYPEAMRGAFEGGQISPMDAWKNRPDTADAAGDPDAQIAELVRSIEGPFADPNDQNTWAKIDPAGLGFLRLKLETGGQVTDAMIDAVLPSRDNRAVIAYLKWFADMKQKEYLALVNDSSYKDSKVTPLQLQQAKAASVHATSNYGRAVQGDGEAQAAGANAGANADATPAQPAGPMPTQPPAAAPQAPQNDAAMIARQIAERMFPGVPLQSLTPQQKQQIADQLNAMNGG